MQLEIKFLYSLLYLDTITFSQSGSIKRTSSESSEATDIVTLLGLSGGSEQRKKKYSYFGVHNTISSFA